jgi:hypothetical protein
VEYEMSERDACRLMGLGRSTHCYRARQDGDAWLRMRLKELAAQPHAVRVSATDGDAGAGRDAGQSQAGVPAVRRGRVGDADSATTADPLEGYVHELDMQYIRVHVARRTGLCFTSGRALEEASFSLSSALVFWHKRDERAVGSL